MRRLLLSGIALLGLVAAAQAADLPITTKAVPAAAGFPYASSGFYWGIGASSAAANASVSNSGVFAVGAGLDAVVGYQWKGGLDFIAAEVVGTWTNLGSSAACTTAAGAVSCAASNAFEIEPRVKFGFPINSITTALPNLSSYFPGLPTFGNSTTASNSTQHPYLFVGAPIRDVSANFGLMSGQAWTIQPEIGVGNESQWTNGLVLDISAGCTVGNSGFDFGVAGVTTAHADLSTSCQTRVHFLY